MVHLGMDSTQDNNTRLVDNEQKQWQQLIQGLLAYNEMLYID